MENKVIIINGLGGSGKSTFAQLCISYANSFYPNLLVKELSSIDFVKEVASFCGWDGSKTTKNRTFLHDLKVLLEEWDNVPNKKVLELIEKGPKDNSIYFVNIRENYNIDAFKEMCKNTNCFCFTLLVRNPNIVTNEVPELIQQINNYYYDVIIDNDKDLNHLKLLAQNFIEDLSKSKF